MNSTQSAAAELDSSGSIGHYIGGDEVVASSNIQAVFNPTSGSLGKQLALTDADIVEQALSGANDAFPSWRNRQALKSAQIEFRFKQLLQQHADEICQPITARCWKMPAVSRSGIQVVEYACGISESLKGEHSKNAEAEIDSWSEFQPAVNHKKDVRLSFSSNQDHLGSV